MPFSSDPAHGNADILSSDFIPDLSLIIPTFNETENISILLDQVESVLRNISHEIIVVDDNSPDGTTAVVKELSKKNPNLRLVIRTERKGLSAAVVDGFGRSRGRILAVMDADLSHDPNLLPQFIKVINDGYFMVVGSRRVEGGGADHWPWVRRLYSNLATILAVKLFHLPIRDPMSGYFAIRKDVYDKFQASLNPMGYKILLEIILRGQISSVKEIPFIFKDRKQGISKLSGKVATQYFFMLIQLRRYISFFGLFK